MIRGQRHHSTAKVHPNPAPQLRNRPLAIDIRVQDVDYGAECRVHRVGAVGLTLQLLRQVGKWREGEGTREGR